MLVKWLLLITLILMSAACSSSGHDPQRNCREIGGDPIIFSGF